MPKLVYTMFAGLALVSFAIAAPRPRTMTEGCELNGVKFQEGSHQTINGHDCTCRDGKWDCK